MTRSGPIAPENAVEAIDQGSNEYALWEHGETGAFSPPRDWVDMASRKALDLASVVKSAQVVAMAARGGEAAHRLLDSVLGSVGPQCRLYLYGDRALERDAAFVRKLKNVGDRALARLGARPPADWLTVDAGANGLLFAGPATGSPRWAIPVCAEVSQSLFVAFRTLFWFHADREALPDAGGASAMRKPLDSPFRDPGTDSRLPAGRLGFGQAFDDAVPDAEIRVSPPASGAAAARLFFVHPGAGAVSLKRPLARHKPGSRVVWADTGLPETAVTRRRMVTSFTEARTSLQLEWPAKDAIAMLNCLDDAAREPEWEFRPAARLGSVKGKVLLDGATEPAAVAAATELDGGDVPAPLSAFDHARPKPFPDIPPLALKVKVKWRRIPARVPRDAGKAEIQKDWDRADEWWKRVADGIRGALEDCKDPDDNFQELARIEEELTEACESPPSREPAEAGEILAKLAELADSANRVRQSIVERRQRAEDEAERAKQKAEWKSRIERAKANMEASQRKLSDLEARPRPSGTVPRRVRREIADLKKKIGNARRAASEKFRFREPKRLPQPQPINTQPPSVPPEALPEIGELYERNGKRFLAIRKWEEFEHAMPVAERLGAELVAARPDAANPLPQ